MKTTNYFTFTDNFAKTEHVKSVPVFEAKLNFVPKVTIAIPTYKRTDLLKESIDSAINQSDYDDYDIIVVDNNPERDCDTEKLLLSYNNPKISYYKNSENIGLVGNLNRLFTLAQGEYVVELHDDDMLYPDFLSVLLKFTDRTNEKYDGIYPGKVIYNMKKSTKIPPRTPSSEIQVHDLEVNDFLRANIVGNPIHLIKKSSFLEFGGYSNDFYPAIDLDFYIRFAHKYKTCMLAGYPLNIYRIAENMSCKTDTLLGFISKETEMKKNILELKKNIFPRYFWDKYFNVYAFKYLHGGKDIFQNTEIQVNKELLDLGFKYEKFDVLIYKIMNRMQKISFKVRSSRYSLVERA